MIISIEKAKGLVSFPESWTDDKIKMKLLAVEQTIRAYTNNNFQDRGFRVRADIAAGVFKSESLIPFSIGDTVQVSESRFNKGLFTVSTADDRTFTVGEETRDEDEVLVTKVVYPADVIDCCVNLLEWEVKNRGKVGIKSETLSRHSVTYEDSASMFRGYPKGILNSVWHYRKARC
jgi:hypothetical protein